MIELTGLWISKTRKGARYLAGNLGHKVRVMIFVNQNKRENSKDPDYYLCIDQRKPDGTRTAGHASDEPSI
jgi:hypothetical protein